MTEPEATLKDIWTLLCRMDRDINERFDRIEHQLVAFDGRLVALAARLSAIGEKISAIDIP
jgi:hypothetical protein